MKSNIKFWHPGSNFFGNFQHLRDSPKTDNLQLSVLVFLFNSKDYEFEFSVSP